MKNPHDVTIGFVKLLSICLIFVWIRQCNKRTQTNHKTNKLIQQIFF